MDKLLLIIGTVCFVLAIHLFRLLSISEILLVLGLTIGYAIVLTIQAKEG